MAQPVLLDYRRPSDRRRRGWPWLVLVAMLAAMAGGAGIFIGQKSLRLARINPGPADGGTFVIDCDVPGTEVYLRHQSLGIVPVSLDADDLLQLGLPVLPSEGSTWLANFDGCGEGIFLGEQDELETRLMFRVPDAVAGQFLSIETPWGRRTKSTGGGQLEAALIRPRMLPVGQQGLSLSIACAQRVSRDADRITVEACVTNLGFAPHEGLEPVMVLQWGAFDTPWRRRTTCNVSLPLEWSRIEPGATLRTQVEIPAPSVAADYSLFASFALAEATETGHVLKGNRPLYSDSILMRVR